MKIILYPQVSNETLNIVKNDDILIINDQEFDFSSLPDGYQINTKDIGCNFIIGDVKRENGEILIGIRIPISIDSPESSCFPEPLINPPNGELELPK